jgi:hypothetical protein
MIAFDMASVVKKRRRYIQAKAALVTNSGDERAHAWGTFLEPERDKDR